MPYRGHGTHWYKVHVEVDGERRIYVDMYSSTANAVFGVLRKLEVDRTWEPDPYAIVKTWCALLPPKPPRMSRAAYTRLLRGQHELVR